MYFIEILFYVEFQKKNIHQIPGVVLYREYIYMFI